MTRDNEHVFIDPNIHRKGELLEEHISVAKPDGPEVPLFSLVEFNLSGLCNRTCVFCPRVDPNVYPNVNEHISVGLYTSIMEQLNAVDYDGLILYSAFGEPLLNKSIELLIEITKRFCPAARLETVTDGDFVTLAKLIALFDAGLDTLLISMYDGPEQEDHFLGLRDHVGLSDSQIVLRKRWLPPEEHYGITLSNRAGMVDIPLAGISSLKEPLKRPCFYPFYQVLVDYDGSVLMCPHDWGKKLVIGNLNHQTITDIWNNRLVRRARMNLANSDRNFAPCDVCDVDGTMMGRSHFERWMEYYQHERKV